MPLEEEETEILKLIELKRTTRDEKRAIETDIATEGGDAVVLFERTWRRTAPENLQDIEDAVDGLDLERLRARQTGPEPKEDPTPEEPRHLPQSDAVLEKGADAGGQGLTPLSSEREEAVAAFVRGEVTRAVVVYRTAESEIVEVTFDRDGERHETLLHIKGSRIRDLDTIHRDVDAFDVHRDEEQDVEEQKAPTREDFEEAEREVPTFTDINEPAGEDVAPTADDIDEEIEALDGDEGTAAPPRDDEADAQEQRRHDLEEAEEEVPTLTDINEPAGDTAPTADDIEAEIDAFDEEAPAKKGLTAGIKGRLPFGRKKKAPEGEADAGDNAPAEAAGKKGLRGRLSFGRKGREKADEGDEDASDDAGEDDGDDREGKKGGLGTRLGLKRKK